jgi:hypothetical protein
MQEWVLLFVDPATGFGLFLFQASWPNHRQKKKPSKGLLLLFIIQMFLNLEVHGDHPDSGTEIKCGQKHHQIREKSPTIIIYISNGKVRK